MKHAIHKDALKGVSTLDVNKNVLTFLTFLIIFTAFSTNVFSRSGHSTLDLVDPSFNPRVQTNTYGVKFVFAAETLPSGKILVFGNFNNYNNVPVGKLIRLNADGSLDTTFNNQTVTSISSGATSGRLFIQQDGKIVLICLDTVVGGQSPQGIVRLNTDGTFDPTFNFFQNNHIFKSVIDSSGRLLLMGEFATSQGTRRLIRVNTDGSIDDSYNFIPPTSGSLENIALQGNKLIVVTSGDERRLYRLNEDGSEDTTFMPLTGPYIILEGVQPGNKILYTTTTGTSGFRTLKRLTENGGIDNTYQELNLTIQNSDSPEIKFTVDGKIIIVRPASQYTFYRYLPNGASDPSFNQYTTPNLNNYNIRADDSILICDFDWFSSGSNNFVKLLPNGVRDTTFNPGGTGFQTIQPGKIQAIDTQPDGKVLVGGKFNLVNNVVRPQMARLNTDSTVDNSFQINVTSGGGSYFSAIREIYQMRVQPDGKIIVSGSFDYVLNGVTKINLVRLNSNGSIDSTFDLDYVINDYSQVNPAGQNRFNIYGDGRLMVGTSKVNFSQAYGPIRIAANGSRDTTFNSTLGNPISTVYIHDVALQPDGKVVVAGQTPLGAAKSFVARLNSDGSIDSTFVYTEEDGLMKSRIALLPNGKILIIKYRHPNGSAKLLRLNSDGSVDTSFNSLSLNDNTAKFNALLVLPNGKIFVGGKFTISINGQPGNNLLQLDADGSFEPTLYNINEEVLSLAADADGRVLVGGGFTVIGANGDNATRSYVARLTDSTARFDFDGDGRSDLSAFTSASGKWTIQNSGSNQTTNMVFGLNGDKITAADYDGDNKADIAVFRPSNGVWYLWRSRDGFAALQWGLAEDKPVAADYDGDGLADVATWRPSSGVWYVRQSSSSQLFAVQFGMAGDIPLTDADFDGDGKADIAVWRPSNGVFYWLASGSNHQFRAVQFGQNGDIPVVGDFNGDGKTDLVVFRPANGFWYQYLTQPNGNYSYSGYGFGTNGDEPVVADYDGDGKTDIAVRRGNVWHINRTSLGYVPVLFAEANDLAVPSSLIR